MELFSVACITCRAKIKVQSTAAIGQVLACPRCGAMVEIAPPLGWKPPPAETQAGPTKPREVPPAPRSQSVASQQGQTKPAAKSVSGPVSATNARAGTPAAGDAQASGYVAEVVDDDPLADAARRAAERAHALRRRLLIGGGAVAVLLVFGAAWSLLTHPGEPDAVAAAGGDSAESQATATTAQPTSTKLILVPTSTAAPIAISSATPKVALAATASATSGPPSSALLPSPAATGSLVQTVPSANPANGTALASAAPVGTRIPAPPTPPTPGAAGPPAPSTATVAEVPTATITSPPEPMPPPMAVAPQIDAAARLKQSVAGLRFERTPRKTALRVIAQLAGVPIDYDWDAISPATVGLYDPVTIDAAATVGEAVEKVLAGRNLKFSAGEGRIVIVSDAPPPAAPTSVPGATRRARATTKLQTPVTLNFRPAAPLAQVVEHIESVSGTTITIDHAALAEQGTDGEAPVGVAADKAPLEQVLTAVCEPREWAWRIIDPQTFEITTRDALRRRVYEEAYDLKPLLVDGTSPQQAAEDLQLKAEKLYGVVPGAFTLDAAASTLRVRLHQEAQLHVEAILREAAARSVPAPAATTTGTAPTPRPASTSPPGLPPAPPAGS